VRQAQALGLHQLVVQHQVPVLLVQHYQQLLALLAQARRQEASEL
jgi:hypothetical protein